MELLSDKIKNWCDESITNLIQQYDAAGRRASGNWEKELESRVEETDNGYKIQILGSDYTYCMEKGRKPNKAQDWNSIKAFAGWMSNSNNGPIYQWCKDKGILTAYAFPIAVKIAREGYKGQPLTNKVFTKDWAETLGEKAGLFFTAQLKEDIINQFKTVQ